VGGGKGPKKEIPRKKGKKPVRDSEVGGKNGRPKSGQHKVLKQNISHPKRAAYRENTKKTGETGHANPNGLLPVKVKPERMTTKKKRK